MEHRSPAERLNLWLKQSVVVKMVSIGALIMILLIPGSMIRSLIAEREGTCEETVGEICAVWGDSQTVVGPVLTVPYREYSTDSTGKRTTYWRRLAHFLPETLAVEGMVSPEIRYRSIYKAVLYNARLNLSADFGPCDFTTLGVASEDVEWEKAYLSLGISEMRGIKEQIRIRWDGDTAVARPGTRDGLLGSGVSAPVALDPQQQPDTVHRCSLQLNLNGSKRLAFEPLGKQTDVRIASPWQDPSFEGAFLPEQRTVTGEGFSAHWRVLHLNRNYPQQWIDNSVALGASAFGVSFLLPIDEYQKIMRTAKYAVMFISLTFLAFFLLEIMNHRRLHAIQYLMIGMALSLFFVLLLSLSEQIRFGSAYLVAAAATIGLIGGYCRAVLSSNRLALSIGGLLGVLYGYLYVLMQLQDYALLLGSLGLFVILAATMYVTRRIDWFSIGKKLPS